MQDLYDQILEIRNLQLGFEPKTPTHSVQVLCQHSY